MAAVIQAKTRRSAARCRVTKQVRATEKLLSDDVREIPTEDLKWKLELFKVAVQEELVAQDQLLNVMAVEGASEDGLQKEIEANSVIEDSYEDHTEKMTSAINMGSHFLLYQASLRVLSRQHVTHNQEGRAHVGGNGEDQWKNHRAICSRTRGQ